MSDIVERLKYMAGIPVAGTWGEACNEAAAEIERLREALKKSCAVLAGDAMSLQARIEALAAARAALNPSRPSQLSENS